MQSEFRHSPPSESSEFLCQLRCLQKNGGHLQNTKLSYNPLLLPLHNAMSEDNQVPLLTGEEEGRDELLKHIHFKMQFHIAGKI